jgi:predicted permease
MRVVAHAEVVTGGVRAQLLVLLGAVGLLLVIACANLAGLLLVRGIARGRELAVREALGASRAHLIRGLLTESVLLASAGAVLAIPVAHLVLEAVLALGPADLPRRGEVAIDPLSLLVCASLATLSAAAFGLLPALQSVRLRTAWSTRLSVGNRTTGDPRPRLQHGLAVAQVAVTTVLLIGGGLLGLSFLRLQRADPGFVADGLLTFHITPPPGAYAERDELIAFHRSILEGLQALPAVRLAGATWALPLGDAYGSSGYVPEDRPDSESLVVEIAPVLGDYFEAMGMRIVAGRPVVPEDDGEAETGVLVSESLARRAWPGLDPVGRLLVEDDDPDERLRVVGVVAEVAMRGADATPELETFWPWNGNPWGRSLYYVARTEGDPLALLPAVRDLVRRVDARVPVAEPSTMSDRMSRHFAGPRFRTLLVGVFSVGAALLSLMGIYGVTSFTVRRRTRELGVRKALGARPGALVLAVLGRGLAIAATGAVIGVATAAASARAIGDLLFEVAPLEASVYGAVVLLVMAAAALACALPALRAAGVPATVALSTD